MQKKSLRYSLGAAMLMLAAAYGQNLPMTAKIPFAFRAVGTDLPAGRYKVGPLPGRSAPMSLMNMDTGKTIFIPPQGPPRSDSNDGRPRLIFQCGAEGGCSLASLWSGNGTGLAFPTPALTAAQRERQETIYLDRFKEK
jgi:hypothetical protein